MITTRFKECKKQLFVRTSRKSNWRALVRDTIGDQPVSSGRRKRGMPVTVRKNASRGFTAAMDYYLVKKYVFTYKEMRHTVPYSTKMFIMRT